MSGNRMFQACFAYRMFQACSQVLLVHRHKAVKLNAKIKDSRVSKIQMWRGKNHIPGNTVLMHFLQKKKGAWPRCIIGNRKFA